MDAVGVDPLPRGGGQVLGESLDAAAPPQLEHQPVDDLLHARLGEVVPLGHHASVESIILMNTSAWSRSRSSCTRRAVPSVARRSAVSSDRRLRRSSMIAWGLRLALWLSHSAS